MIKKTLLLIYLYISTLSVEARDKMFYGVSHPDNEIELLNFWSTNHVYNETSLKTINEFTSLPLIKNEKELKEISKTIAVFKNTVEHVQLPKEQLLLLRRYAIAMENHELFRGSMSRYLSDIIWWSEVRLIDDDVKLIEFLIHQFKIKKRREFSFSMFIEKGFVNKLKELSKSISFKNSKSRFNIAIRQSEINKLFLSAKPIKRKFLINEIEWSVSKSIIGKYNNKQIYNYDYINWLIIQLGIYRDRPVVNKVLNDMLRLSKNRKNADALVSLNSEYKYLSNAIHNKNNGVFSISHQVEQALEPFKLFEFFAEI